MTKRTLLISAALALTGISTAQTYYEDDKEGLRAFLQQVSEEEEIINAQQLGLTIADTTTWQTQEEWVSKVAGLTWNNESPKRLITIGWNYKRLSGNLNCSKWTALTRLDCGRNRLTALDVSKNTVLTLLLCGTNRLTALDVSKNTVLEWLQCNNNQLTSLDVSENTALATLNCFGNQLTALDVSKNTELTELFCSNNQLTALDVSNNTELIRLNCAWHQLTALDVSNNTKLTDLNCSYGPLTALDVSNNTELGTLNCSDTQLTVLDVSNNTELWTLDCSWNQLTALDVSNNTALTSLNCTFNQLTVLDVSNNTELRTLSCSMNQLTALDVNNNMDLRWLNCRYNQLTALDVSKNIDLIDLNFAYNYLLFSAIPLRTEQMTTHVYSPQQTIEGGEIEYQEGIDLSNEYDIEGNITQFTWYDISSGSAMPITLNGESGIFTLTEDLKGKRLRCEMTNESFPDLSLRYEVRIKWIANWLENTSFKDGIKVYPNPTGGMLTLINEDEATNEIHHIQVFDATGRLLHETAGIDSKKNTINLSSFEAGIYYLRIKTKNGTVMKNIVKY